MNTRTLHLLDVEYLGCGPVFSAGDLALVLDWYRPRVDWHRGDIAIGTASTWVYERIAFSAQTRTLVFGLVTAVILIALSNALAIVAG